MPITPMRVEFMLAGLVGRSHHPIHLDSLIAHELIRTRYGLSPTGAQIEDALLDLPLERRTIGGDWVWAASTIAFEWKGPPVQLAGTRALRAPEIQKHIDVIAKAKRTHTIDTTRGKWKADQYAASLQQASAARAYLVGDRMKIEPLLKGISTLGARRRHGTCVVSNVALIDDEAAANQCMRRYLPAASNIAGRKREGAYRLPMFDHRNQTIVIDNQLEYER